MSKLRLSFLHSLGGSVEIGDVISRSASTNLDTSRLVSHKYRDLLNATYIKNNNVIMGDNEVLIISFAPRVNKGEQNSPSLPVLIQIKGDNLWIPNIDALIKLQDEHDKAMPTFSEALRNNRPVFEEKLKKVEVITDAAKISECFNDDKQGSDKMNAKLTGYTQDMKDLNVAPEVGMTCKILHHLNLEEATFIAVTDRFLILKNIDGVERMRLTDNINESIFPEHSGEDVEQDTANKKQLDTFPPALRNAGYYVQVDMIKFMQDEGMLAEVLLPLK